MNRKEYDTDVTTWSPQGRIFQIDYAMEAVKEGTAVVGLRTDNFAVLCCLKRQHSDLADYQKKIFRIDDHMGIGISGLAADARVLTEYMRMECLNEKYTFNQPLKVGRLVAQIGDKSQQKTQWSSKRPYGVGLLVAGFDTQGPHIYETSPSGDYYEYKAFALGGRSQSAKTYLEKYYQQFPEADLEGAIYHAVKAVNASAEVELSTRNITIAYVGLDTPFTELSEERMASFLEKLKDDKPEPVVESSEPTPMETS